MRLQRFFPSFDLTCALLLPALIAFRVLITTIAPHDFWWHMAEGRLIATTGAISRADTFSWTQPGAPFFDQSWLSQLLMYGLHTVGGLPLIIFFQAVIVAASYAFLLWFAGRRSGSLRFAALLLVAVMLASFDNWQVRPQSYIVPVFIGFFVILNGYRLGWWRCLWPLPLLMALWANLHGSFPLGLALIVLALLGEGYKMRRAAQKNETTDVATNSPILSPPRWQRLALCGVWCALATLLNPRGIRLYEYVTMMFASPSNRFSGEWLGPSFSSFSDSMFFLFAAATFIALFLLYRRKKYQPDATELLTLLAFALLAFKSGRYIMWFAVVAVAPLSHAFSSAARPSEARSAETHPAESNPAEGRSMEVRRQAPGNLFNLVIVAIVWFMLVPVLPWFKTALELPPPLDSLLAPETPVRAVVALKKLPPAQRPRRLFHNEATGSYLIWAAPEQKVFIDTRFEFYPPQQWRNLLQLRNGRDVDALIAKYRFDGMLIERKPYSTLLKYLKQDRHWHTVYTDRNFSLLLRREAAPRARPGG